MENSFIYSFFCEKCSKISLSEMRHFSLKYKLFFSAISYLLLMFVCPFAFSYFKDASFALGILPTIIVALLFGKRGAVVGGILMFFVIWLLAVNVGYTTYGDVSFIFPGFLGIGSMTLVAASIAALQDFQIKLVEETNRREKMENDMKEQRDVLESLGKLATLGEMTAEISHEISTPLTVILGTAEELRGINEMQVVSRDLLNQRLTEIISLTERVGSIIKSFRGYITEFGQEDICSVELTNIFDIVRDVSINRLKRLGISLIFKGNKLRVKCRKHDVVHILLNLISNSFDAISELEERWIVVEAIQRETQVEISIVDSGKNFAKYSKNPEKVFTPFYTTKTKSKGTGLGLSVAKRFAFANGGDLSLDSSSEHTTFILTLENG